MLNDASNSNKQMTNIETMPQLDNSKDAITKVYITLHGIKKKCRKINRHLLHMDNAKYPLNSHEKENLCSEARKIIARHIKQIDTSRHVYIHFDYAEISKPDSSGFYSEMWQIFDKRHDKTLLVYDAL